MKCTGTTKEGRPCGSFPLEGRDHCFWHGPKCLGTKRDGTQCRAQAKQECDWLYCRADHDPNNLLSTPTEIFRVKGLCNEKRSAVLEYRDHRDAYTLKDNPTRNTHHEMDHVMEIQFVRDAYDVITKYGTKHQSRQKFLLERLKEVVNQTGNLNITTPEINNIKFQACYNFQEAFKKNPDDKELLDQGLFPYLIDAKSSSSSPTSGLNHGRRGGHKLSRHESKRIQQEMLNSGDIIIDQLQDEDALQGQVIETLNKNFTAMRLF